MADVKYVDDERSEWCQRIRLSKVLGDLADVSYTISDIENGTDVGIGDTIADTENVLVEISLWRNLQK